MSKIMAPEEPRRPVLAVVVVTAAIVLLVLAAVGLEVRAADGAREGDEAAALQAEVLLQGLRSTYSRVGGVQARFVQTSSGSSYLEPLVQTGQLAWKRPGLLRWDFQTPTARLYLSDGSTLWVVEEAERRCTVYRGVDASLKRFFGFLTGMEDVKKHFDVSVVLSGDELLEGHHVLELRPNDGEASVQQAFVRIDQKSGFVASVVLLSPFGDRTQTVLESIRTDADLPDSSFKFERQEGYEWIEASLP
ncbi:MAG TPA: hypothetical protein DIU15_07995 [Deltaproteobacteria bacterium]|nr:hypothetical protein [Deltaproteobacteria bacterium]HCP45966.1 hypothetical protein [Deltaproteobacteria bacterium]